VTNPESNMNNAVGSTPALEMMRKGVLLGLGTDAYTTDMMESLKVAGILMRHNHRDPSVGWAEAPKMLFENNKKIINRFLRDKTGELTAGYLADIIVCDYTAPTPVNSETINGHVLFGLAGRNVDTTIINGVVRYENHALVDIDYAEVAAKSQEEAQKLWNRL